MERSKMCFKIGNATDIGKQHNSNLILPKYLANKI